MKLKPVIKGFFVCLSGAVDLASADMMLMMVVQNLPSNKLWQHAAVPADVMYIEAAIPDLVKTLVAAASSFTDIYISHGRNRQAEHVFQNCCQGRFLVSQVSSNQLDDVYQTGDVDVLQLQSMSKGV